MTEETTQNTQPDATLDCIGLYCPVPIAKTREAIDELESGQVLKMEADDPGAEEDIPRWAKHAGHEILKMEKNGKIIRFLIRKG